MTNNRRRGNHTQYHQGSLSAEVAQPVHDTFLSVPYEQWNFANSHDSMMAPPPTTLSLTVPGDASDANYMNNPSHMLYSPASDGFSQSQLSDSYPLPSYGNSLMDDHADNVFPKLDPALQSASLSPSETMKTQFEGNEKTERFGSIGREVKTKYLSPSATQSSHSSTSSNVNMSPKQRAVHRKQIEEKSSLKRKQAEHRLSRAISSRLNGTFIPGLANQLNQAADIIEKDTQTILSLEAEIKQLRAQTANADVQRKFRNY